MRSLYRFSHFINESSSSGELVKYRDTLLGIFESLYEMDCCSNNMSVLDLTLTYGYVTLRGSQTISPGQFIDVRSSDSNPQIHLSDPEKAEYGFSMKMGGNRYDAIKRIKSRALDLFERQTGVALEAMETSHHLIISYPKTIGFIKELQSFEDSIYDIAVNLDRRYYGSVSIDVADPFKIIINFSGGINGGTGGLKIFLSRGFVLGNSIFPNLKSSSQYESDNLPVGEYVEYELQYISLLPNSTKNQWNSFKSFYDMVKDLRVKFKINIYDDPSKNVKILYDVIENNILSLYVNDVIKLRETIESELSNLSSYQIGATHEYLTDNKIEVDLEWRENNYHFILIIGSLSNLDTIMINQFGRIIGDSDPSDLSENIYLFLVDDIIKPTKKGDYISPFN